MNSDERRPQTVPPRVRVKGISARRILNSQSRWTNEFTVELLDGVRGVGSSPQGETPSTYEHSSENENPGDMVIRTISSGDLLTGNIDQIEFDNLLDMHRPKIGQNNSYALSLAFLDACRKSQKLHPYVMLANIFGLTPPEQRRFPRLLLNVLNGGQHAYTNAIQSDFCEYLLVPRGDCLQTNVDSFQSINRIVSDKLGQMPTVKVGPNWVRCQKSADNRAWIDFLLAILQSVGLENDFDLMIDASAGDLFKNSEYQLHITGGGSFTPEAFVEYWSALLSDYPISILEDPLAEEDADSWRALTINFPDRLIAGDNLCATDAQRISSAAEHGLATAVLIKPNQAGTVTATIHALHAANDFGIVPIPSHRSIETESSFLSDLCYLYGVPYAKLGLLSDFETIIKLNKLIRYFDHNNNHNR